MGDVELGRGSIGDQAVGELIGDEVVRVAPTTTAREVAEVLTRAGIGVVVLGAGVPSGVVSERDVVKAAADGRDLDATPASEIASTELVWADVDATVAEVAAEMAEQFLRHVLIEANGELVGIVSARDLLGVYAAADLDLD